MLKMQLRCLRCFPTQARLLKKTAKVFGPLFINTYLANVIVNRTVLRLVRWKAEWRFSTRKRARHARYRLCFCDFFYGALLICFHCSPKDNFSFKCHRSEKIIYSVNGIAVHPRVTREGVAPLAYLSGAFFFLSQYGSLATVGSDGGFAFWDKVNRTRLKVSFLFVHRNIIFNLDTDGCASLYPSSTLTVRDLLRAATLTQTAHSLLTVRRGGAASLSFA